MKIESEVTQSCLTLRDHMDCSLPGSSVHGIYQARVLEWGSIAFSDKVPLSPLFVGGKNTGVGCHSLLQEIFLSQGSNPDLSHCRWKVLLPELPGKSKLSLVLNLFELSVNCRLLEMLIVLGCSASTLSVLQFSLRSVFLNLQQCLLSFLMTSKC